MVDADRVGHNFINYLNNFGYHMSNFTHLSSIIYRILLLGRGVDLTLAPKGDIWDSSSNFMVFLVCVWSSLYQVPSIDRNIYSWHHLYIVESLKWVRYDIEYSGNCWFIWKDSILLLYEHNFWNKKFMIWF